MLGSRSTVTFTPGGQIKVQANSTVELTAAVLTVHAPIAVFDGMGHGLASAQLVSLVVNAYRNARRAHRSLTETIRLVDAAVTDIFAGEAFCTALLAELDTDTGEFRWVSAGHLAAHETGGTARTRLRPAGLRHRGRRRGRAPRTR